MHKNAILINTSRGYIHNEKDIYEALSSNKIFGAGLDVFENEPLQKSSPLRSLKNVLLTPHSAPNKECYPRAIRNAITNIIRIFEGKSPLSCAKDYDEITEKFLNDFPNIKFMKYK